MAKPTRRADWGFPRWSDYGRSHEAVSVRMCDYPGCAEPGDCPAPKHRDSKEKWWFCQTHAGEYNRNWNYFEGLTEAEVAEREEKERQSRGNARRAQHWSWSSAGGDGMSAGVRDAFKLFELESDADAKAIKAAYRRLAKLYHPDSNPGSTEAAEKFQAVRIAYDALMGWVASRSG